MIRGRLASFIMFLGKIWLKLKRDIKILILSFALFLTLLVMSTILSAMHVNPFATAKVSEVFLYKEFIQLLILQAFMLAKLSFCFVVTQMLVIGSLKFSSIGLVTNQNDCNEGKHKKDYIAFNKEFSRKIWFARPNLKISA